MQLKKIKQLFITFILATLILLLSACSNAKINQDTNTRRNTTEKSEFSTFIQKQKHAYNDETTTTKTNSKTNKEENHSTQKENQNTYDNRASSPDNLEKKITIDDGTANGINSANGQQSNLKGTQYPETSNTTVNESLSTEIVNKYYKEAESLRNEYLERLTSLAEQAKEEYESLPDNATEDEKKKLYSKYVQIVENMESECDARFNDILENLKTELEANGFPYEDEIENAKQQYQAEKSGAAEKILNSIQ